MPFSAHPPDMQPWGPMSIHGTTLTYVLPYGTYSLYACDLTPKKGGRMLLHALQVSDEDFNITNTAVPGLAHRAGLAQGWDGRTRGSDICVGSPYR